MDMYELKSQGSVTESAHIQNNINKRADKNKQTNKKKTI
jgi:hypothetical protein